VLKDSLELGVRCVSVVFQFSGEVSDGGGRVASSDGHESRRL
jgi:hypothetical protein